jgi:hypothetical protein
LARPYIWRLIILMRLELAAEGLEIGPASDEAGDRDAPAD